MSTFSDDVQQARTKSMRTAKRGNRQKKSKIVKKNVFKRLHSRKDHSVNWWKKSSGRNTVISLTRNLQMMSLRYLKFQSRTPFQVPKAKNNGMLLTRLVDGVKDGTTIKSNVILRNMFNTDGTLNIEQKDWNHKVLIKSPDFNST